MARRLLAAAGALAVLSAPASLASTSHRVRHARHTRHHASRSIGPAGSSAPATAGGSSDGPLVGTFELAPGTYSAGAGAGGSYFRMINPGGSVASGPYFDNSSSTASDHSYTLLRPGSDGGLVTGAFQPAPSPAFDGQGSALAARIVSPEPFEGRSFSLSTASPDGQAATSVPAPAVVDSGGSLRGQVEAFDAEWNGQWFNQGSPKPGGASPGATQPVSGTYNPDTHAFVLVWASTVVGGPFNGFTGYWHLAGTFVRAG